MERDSYGYDDKGILYHINRENGREYNATVVPKVLVKTLLKEMHDNFGHFGIGKTTHWSKGIITGLKWSNIYKGMWTGALFVEDASW